MGAESHFAFAAVEAQGKPAAVVHKEQFSAVTAVLEADAELMPDAIFGAHQFCISHWSDFVSHSCNLGS